MVVIVYATSVAQVNMKKGNMRKTTLNIRYNNQMLRDAKKLSTRLSKKRYKFTKTDILRAAAHYGLVHFLNEYHTDDTLTKLILSHQE
jgi:hypothetical protein